MTVTAVVIPFTSEPFFEKNLRQFVQSSSVSKIYVLHTGTYTLSLPKCEGIKTESFFSGATLNWLLKRAAEKYVLVVTQALQIELGPTALERLLSTAEDSNAGIVYSDFHEMKNDERREHPVLDYQIGSIRDGFDFGAMMLFSVPAARTAMKKYGVLPNVYSAGLYDLRLKISIDRRLIRIKEFLYTQYQPDDRLTGEQQFDYVDPKNRRLQEEMESVATHHLKNIGAYLKPKFKHVPMSAAKFPVVASVIIPVRNRKNTVAQAIGSALDQKTDFAFNVIVIDNHSTDGTTDIVAALAIRNPALCHIIPERLDLGIGGCWNDAVMSNKCGKYAVQLDSDDLFADNDVLRKIVGTFNKGDFAMVVGSYRLVDMNLQEIPPGVIDHREWTPKNGRNNALRINGLGAPRAFNTALCRQVLFPNVSYGEDYSIGLRLSREFQIGRIYEPIYLCRRWEGNSDASLTIEATNRNDSYKDFVRTVEILARQKINQKR